jgi:hypothetical protein
LQVAAIALAWGIQEENGGVFITSRLRTGGGIREFLKCRQQHERQLQLRNAELFRPLRRRHQGKLFQYDGRPLFHYEDGKVKKDFVGGDIRKEESELGAS